VVQYFYNESDNKKKGELVIVLKSGTPVRMEIKHRRDAEIILKKVVEVVKDYN
jgi:hypothetical protein